MMTLRTARILLCPALLGALVLAGCNSPRVDAVVVNHTGAAINLVEVDYPTASFGMDTLADGARYAYRFQIRGNGAVSVQYTESKSLKVVKIAGPELSEGQQGHIEIDLLPEGKAHFMPQLSEAH